jgi:hypothetical protein
VSFKRLSSIVRYLHALSAQLLGRAKGLPEEPAPAKCSHIWITLKRRRFCRLCRRFDKRVDHRWRPLRRETGGWN